MNKIVLGKYVNTHGLKGEIRITSSFKFKDRVFKKGNEIILDKPYIINTYRKHKNYDMVTLVGINKIEDIISLKNSLVYINRDKYLDGMEYLDTDLIGFRIICLNKVIGIVDDILYLNNKKKIVKVGNKFIPFELVLKVDLVKKELVVEYLEGLIEL